MNAAIADDFLPDSRHPDGVLDPVFGVVQRGSIHGMWAVNGPGIGLAQLTGGSRVVTPSGDGSLSKSGSRLRRDGVPVCWLRAVRRGSSRSYEVLHWADPPDRTAAAIAHLLGSRYGVGAVAAFPLRTGSASAGVPFTDSR